LGISSAALQALFGNFRWTGGAVFLLFLANWTAGKGRVWTGKQQMKKSGTSFHQKKWKTTVGKNDK
jgi:hypothetical protein